MANQSFLSVPPNIEDPVVLRRYLSRISEQLDVAFGNRGGADSAYVEQRALIESASSLSQQLAQAQSTLDQALLALSNTLNADYEDVITQLQDLTSELNLLDQELTTFKLRAAIKGYLTSFTVDGSNNLVFSVDFNINKAASSRLAQGHYRLFLTTNSIEGVDILANSLITFSNNIAPITAAYNVEVAPAIVPNSFDIKVYKLIINGANIERQAYDILPSDVLRVHGSFNVPGSTL